MSDGRGDGVRPVASPPVVSAAPAARKGLAGVLRLLAGLWWSVPGRPPSGAQPLWREFPAAKAGPRMLEDVFLNENWIVEKAEARREFRETRDDLEARP